MKNSGNRIHRTSDFLQHSFLRTCWLCHFTSHNTKHY